MENLISQTLLVLKSPNLIACSQSSKKLLNFPTLNKDIVSAYPDTDSYISQN